MSTTLCPRNRACGRCTVTPMNIHITYFHPYRLTTRVNASRASSSVYSQSGQPQCMSGKVGRCHVLSRCGGKALQLLQDQGRQAQAQDDPPSNWGDDTSDAFWTSTRPNATGWTVSHRTSVTGCARAITRAGDHLRGHMLLSAAFASSLLKAGEQANQAAFVLSQLETSVRRDQGSSHVHEFEMKLSQLYNTLVHLNNGTVIEINAANVDVFCVALQGIVCVDPWHMRTTVPSSCS